jgi:hypothetical protein
MASPDTERDRRLAEALRANLRRRKEQARAATEAPAEHDVPPAVTPLSREP